MARVSRGTERSKGEKVEREDEKGKMRSPFSFIGKIYE